MRKRNFSESLDNSAKLRSTKEQPLVLTILLIYVPTMAGLNPAGFYLATTSASNVAEISPLT